MLWCGHLDYSYSCLVLTESVGDCVTDSCRCDAWPHWTRRQSLHRPRQRIATSGLVLRQFLYGCGPASFSGACPLRQSNFLLLPATLTSYSFVPLYPFSSTSSSFLRGTVVHTSRTDILPSQYSSFLPTTFYFTLIHSGTFAAVLHCRLVLTLYILPILT